MNWFEFKDTYNGKRDSYGLTKEDWEEQKEMQREFLAEIDKEEALDKTDQPAGPSSIVYGAIETKGEKAILSKQNDQNSTQEESKDNFTDGQVHGPRM